MILEEIDWIEYHPNGNVWITGKIGVVAEMWKHLYDYRLGFKGYENVPICRLGEWTKHFDNGQLAWTLDFGDGTHGCKKNKFPQYRKTGELVEQ